MTQVKYSETPLELPVRRRREGPLLVDGRLRAVGSVARRPWRERYVRRIFVSDVGCAALAALAGALVRFGPETSAATPASLAMAVALPVVWGFAMLVARTYEERFLWDGPEEFRRVFLAAALLLATVGTVSWAIQLEVARGFVVVALPLATLATLTQRYLWRQHVGRRRKQGELLQTTLLVGHRSGVEALNRQIHGHPRQGYRVIGCCLPTVGGAAGQSPDGLPLLGDLAGVASVVRRHGVDTVAVLPSSQLDGAALRRLAWELEKTPAALVLVPAVTEIVGPRVRIRPMSGLSVLHVERPELKGVRRFTKGAFDRSAAAFGIFLLMPMLLTIAVLVKATSPGPVLFRQERVGRHGETFRMLKFRTMVDGADRMVETLGAENDGNGVLFKRKADPRVTRIGAVLRRYSLDELPQLLNVVAGTMSLVGPRPPLPSEVDRYGFDMHRRFLVKPGLTGLWQISGRSDLSWDESVRIDIRYVENWSLTFDLMILWRTLGAVMRGSGAY
jgi:exopolysaccharide biosynthesis polyprenyl glycosylphosphotransferase